MVRVAAVQVSIEDRESPKDRLDRVVDQVAGLAESADLVVLPEMWTVGAFNTHLFMGNAQAPAGANPFPALNGVFGLLCGNSTLGGQSAYLWQIALGIDTWPFLPTRVMFMYS